MQIAYAIRLEKRTFWEEGAAVGGIKKEPAVANS